MRDHEIPQVVGAMRARDSSEPSGCQRLGISVTYHLDPPLAHEVFPCLPLPDQRELIAANQRFCRQRTRIVIRRHHKSVRARAHDCEQIAFVQFGHFPVERKKIAGLAYRPDNIDLTVWSSPARLFTCSSTGTIS